MSPLFDAFWRAAAYCLHPRVVALSFLPVVLMVALALGLGYWFWHDAVAAVSHWLEANELLTTALSWLTVNGWSRLQSVVAQLVVVLLAIPLVVVTSLLLVGLLMTPSMVSLVAERRFPHLERRRGASWWHSLGWSLLSTLLAALAMLASLPLWLVPPLVMVLPPRIWGWLTYRVFAFDALADHASASERKRVFAEHRLAFLAMGIMTGYLGALPSFLWASGAMFIAMAPLIVPVAVWLYALVFAFSSLWFAHFALAALHRLRAQEPVDPPADRPADGSPPPSLPPSLPGPSSHV